MIRKNEKTSPEKEKKVSYKTKQESACPICKATHFYEGLLSGRGRLIAGPLTKELRREYIPSKKYGTIIPLIYALQVCPKCLYAAYPKDFVNIKTEEEIKKLKETESHRFNLSNVLFGGLDFNKERDLPLGALSFVLAIDCYHFRHKSIAPTTKKAISSFRAAWLFDDLFKEVNYRPYNKVSDFYYMEAAKDYEKALEYIQSGEESADHVSYMLGPDLDHNWGYDGVLYLNAFFTKKYIHEFAGENEEDKIDLLEKARRYLSKIYGLGRANSSRPDPMVQLAKELFDEITDTIENLKNEYEKDK